MVWTNAGEGEWYSVIYSVMDVRLIQFLIVLVLLVPTAVSAGSPRGKPGGELP